MNPDLLVVLGSALGTLLAAAAILAWLWRRLRALIRLADDLLGEPARPGQPARPGVMERLAGHDQLIAGLSAQVQILQGQIGALLGTTRTHAGGTRDH